MPLAEMLGGEKASTPANDDDGPIREDDRNSAAIRGADVIVGYYYVDLVELQNA